MLKDGADKEESLPQPALKSAFTQVIHTRGCFFYQHQESRRPMLSKSELKLQPATAK